MSARSVLRTAVFLVAIVPAAAPAQTVAKQLENDLRNFGGDVWSVWTSPFRAGTKDWVAAALVIGGSAAVAPFDDNVDRWMVSNRSNSAWGAIRELREGGLAFSGKYITPVAAGALVYGLATNNTKVQEGIFGCLASYASGSVVRNYVIYPLVGRRRPSPDKENPSAPATHGDQYEFSLPGKFDDWGTHSVPAGHAANIVACASFLGNRFEMGYVEPALYLVSAGIGVGRLVDRRHWTSDTMLGMTFGYAIGREVARRSLNRAAAATAAGAAAATLLDGAYVSPSKSGVTLGWRTTF